MKVKINLAWVLMSVFLFSACQAFFTTSPFAFAQRDVNDLPWEQQIQFAFDALASGDIDAMQDAFDALKKKASKSKDPDINLLGAHLAMELSGIPDILNEVLGCTIDFSDSQTEKEDQFSDFMGGLDADYMNDAAELYQEASTNGAELSGTDYLLGASCILFAGSDGDDVTTVDPDSQDNAAAFIELGLADDSVDQVTKDLLQDYLDFIREI